MCENYISYSYHSWEHIGKGDWGAMARDFFLAILYVLGFELLIGTDPEWIGKKYAHVYSAGLCCHICLHIYANSIYQTCFRYLDHDGIDSYHCKDKSNSRLRRVIFKRQFLFYLSFYGGKGWGGISPLERLPQIWTMYTTMYRSSSDSQKPPQWTSGLSVRLVSGRSWAGGRWFDPRQRQTKVFKTGSSGFPPWRSELWIVLRLARQCQDNALVKIVQETWNCELSPLNNWNTVDTV